MKVTVENIKGLNKDIKVFIDKKTMNDNTDPHTPYSPEHPYHKKHKPTTIR